MKKNMIIVINVFFMSSLHGADNQKDILKKKPNESLLKDSSQVVQVSSSLTSDKDASMVAQSSTSSDSKAFSSLKLDEAESRERSSGSVESFPSDSLATDTSDTNTSLRVYQELSVGRSGEFGSSAVE